MLFTKLTTLVVLVFGMLAAAAPTAEELPGLAVRQNPPAYEDCEK